ncbi:hypothetical protein UCMB321_4292 [Pseudomonas batumici]|uniref:Ribbon-helix-helix domain-containing protein n=2 Tax=Pseudomonas batumici TaxID=226910 RepID=A0A0C2IA55_9PSED|nr:hypothetical protein UCMB321_4292 [Pseudomonas batumici]
MKMVQWVGHEVGSSGCLRKTRVDPLLLDFDIGLAKPVSRSVRLNGFATCLRLEEVYWKVLADIANTHECTVNALLSNVDMEVHLRYGGVKNFSGLIRVVCVVHLLTLGGLSRAI